MTELQIVRHSIQPTTSRDIENASYILVDAFNHIQHNLAEVRKIVDGNFKLIGHLLANTRMGGTEEIDKIVASNFTKLGANFSSITTEYFTVTNSLITSLTDFYTILNQVDALRAAQLERYAPEAGTMVDLFHRVTENPDYKYKVQELLTFEKIIQKNIIKRRYCMHHLVNMLNSIKIYHEKIGGESSLYMNPLDTTFPVENQSIVAMITAFIPKIAKTIGTIVSMEMAIEDGLIPNWVNSVANYKHKVSFDPNFYTDMVSDGTFEGLQRNYDRVKRALDLEVHNLSKEKDFIENMEVLRKRKIPIHTIIAAEPRIFERKIEVANSLADLGSFVSTAGFAVNEIRKCIKFIDGNMETCIRKLPGIKSPDKIAEYSTYVNILHDLEIDKEKYKEIQRVLLRIIKEQARIKELENFKILESRDESIINRLKFDERVAKERVAQAEKLRVNRLMNRKEELQRAKIAFEEEKALIDQEISGIEIEPGRGIASSSSDLVDTNIKEKLKTGILTALESIPESSIPDPSGAPWRGGKTASNGGPSGGGGTSHGGNGLVRIIPRSGAPDTGAVLAKYMDDMYIYHGFPGYSMLFDTQFINPLLERFNMYVSKETKENIKDLDKVITSDVLGYISSTLGEVKKELYTQIDSSTDSDEEKKKKLKKLNMIMVALNDISITGLNNALFTSPRVPINEVDKYKIRHEVILGMVRENMNRVVELAEQDFPTFSAHAAAGAFGTESNFDLGKYTAWKGKKDATKKELSLLKGGSFSFPGSSFTIGNASSVNSVSSAALNYVQGKYTDADIENDPTNKNVLKIIAMVMEPLRCIYSTTLDTELGKLLTQTNCDVIFDNNHYSINEHITALFSLINNNDVPTIQKLLFANEKSLFGKTYELLDELLYKPKYDTQKMEMSKTFDDINKIIKEKLIKIKEKSTKEKEDILILPYIDQIVNSLGNPEGNDIMEGIYSKTYFSLLINTILNNIESIKTKEQLDAFLVENLTQKATNIAKLEVDFPDISEKIDDQIMHGFKNYVTVLRQLFLRFSKHSRDFALPDAEINELGNKITSNVGGTNNFEIQKICDHINQSFLLMNKEIMFRNELLEKLYAARESVKILLSEFNKAYLNYMYYNLVPTTYNSALLKRNTRLLATFIELYLKDDSILKQNYTQFEDKNDKIGFVRKHLEKTFVDKEIEQVKYFMTHNVKQIINAINKYVTLDILIPKIKYTNTGDNTYEPGEENEQDVFAYGGRHKKRHVAKRTKKTIHRK